MVDFTYSIVPATGKVTEGGSFTVTITPKSALSSDVTVRWVIVPKGKLPISGSDFSTLTGTYDFSSGDDGDDGHTFTFTPSDDNILEPGKDFEIFFYQVVGNDDYTGSETDDELIGSSQVHLADDEASGDVNTVKFPGTSGGNILTLGSTDDMSVANNNENDVYILTQHQYGDVTIEDVAAGATGSNLIKLDYGVTITDVSETATDLSFLGLGVTYDEITLTLSTGAEVTIKTPASGFSFQLGDDEVISTYAAFKSEIGATGTNATSALASNKTINFTSTNTAPTVTGTPSVDVTEDKAKTDFAASDFNFDDADTGDTLKAVKVTALPGAGTLELGSDAGHDSSTTYTAVTVGQSIAAADIAKLRYTPAANATTALTFSDFDIV